MTNFQLHKDRVHGSFGLTLGVTTASIAFVMELTLLPLLLSAIQRDLGLSVVELAWVFNAYAVAVALAVLGVAFVGDKMDKRTLFLSGVALFAIGSMLSAMSDGLNALILSRIVQGIGGGLFSPLVPVLLTQANPEQSGRILMIWGGLAGVAAAVLPILGASLLAGFGWPAIFFAFSAVAILGLLFVALGQDVANTYGPKDMPNYRMLLSNRGYWLLLSYIFLTYGCFSYYLFHFPVSWREIGFSGRSVSIMLTCVWLSFSVVSFLLRDKMEWRGLNRSLLVAPALLAASFAIAALDQNNPPLQLLSAVFVGAGLACCNSPSTHLLLRVSPKDLRAISSCLDITAARCGGVAVVTLLTMMSPFSVLLAVAAFSGLAMFASQLFQQDFQTAE